jgi:hypothetical protein
MTRTAPRFRPPQRDRAAFLSARNDRYEVRCVVE